MSNREMRPGFMEPGIGAKFQEETKYTPEKVSGHTLDWSLFPDPYKNYDNALGVVALPEPDLPGSPGLWKTILGRRSRRSYKPGATLKLDIFSTLLWATQGITAEYGDICFRTAPSAGGLFPVETYLSARLVEGLKPGIYHFRPRAFDLEFIQEGDLSSSLTKAALGQRIVMDAQVTFIWSAILARGKWKYRERAYRYIYLDAGHIAQNLYLAGEALGLGVCAIGAFFDDEANEIIGVDGTDETVIYMATVGISGGNRKG
jgi:SagB-type dehydrogenase family enzyme